MSAIIPWDLWLLLLASGSALRGPGATGRRRNGWARSTRGQIPKVVQKLRIEVLGLAQFLCLTCKPFHTVVDGSGRSILWVVCEVAW
jgi:hypothetical protein